MKNIKKILYITLIFILSIIITGCSLFSSGPIEFTNKEINLKSGEAYQLEKKETSATVLYKSSDPSIVSVNETTGYITAIKAGTVTITMYEQGNESKVFGIQTTGEVKHGLLNAIKYGFDKFCSTITRTEQKQND